MHESQQSTLLFDNFKKEIESRQDIHYRLKENFSSLTNIDSFFPLLADFYVSPLMGMYHPIQLNEFSKGLIKGITPKIEEKSSFMWHFSEEGKNQLYLRFNRIEFSDYPIVERNNHQKREIIIYDPSILNKIRKRGLEFEFFIQGLEEVEGNPGVMRKEIGELIEGYDRDKERSLERKIRIWVFPDKQIMQKAYHDRLDPRSFINVKRLIRHNNNRTRTDLSS